MPPDNPNQGLRVRPSLIRVTKTLEDRVRRVRQLTVGADTGLDAGMLCSEACSRSARLRPALGGCQHLFDTRGVDRRAEVRDRRTGQGLTPCLLGVSHDLRDAAGRPARLGWGGQNALLAYLRASEGRACPLDRLNDLEYRDLLRRASQHVSAITPFNRPYKPRARKRLEVLGQVAPRHAVEVGQPGAGHRPHGLAQHDAAVNRPFHTSGELHEPTPLSTLLFSRR